MGIDLKNVISSKKQDKTEVSQRTYSLLTFVNCENEHIFFLGYGFNLIIKYRTLNRSGNRQFFLDYKDCEFSNFSILY